jgi:hypothetical protein
MSARKLSSIRPWIRLPAGFLLLMALSGCVDYLERRDTITLAAGDAQDWNKVVHTADPWPPYAMNNHIPGDGKRTAQVIQRYSTGNSTSSGNAGSDAAPASSGGADAAAAPNP